MKNQRIINLRAIAVIIVALGHSIMLYSSNWNVYSTDVTCKLLDDLKRLIDIIQMPLFFSLSGYLFYIYQKKRSSYLAFVRAKAKRLVIPFLMFTFFWLLPIRMLLKYPGYENVDIAEIITNRLLLGFDNGHLWYLQALFFIFLIMFYVCKIIYESNNAFVYFMAFIMVFIFSYLASKSSADPLIKNTVSNLAWFYLGFFINRFENTVINRKCMVASAICALVFVFIDFNFIVWPTFVRYLASLAMVVLFYNVIPDKKFDFISKIARDSYGIYLIHTPLVYITYSFLANESPVVVTLLNFFVFGGVAIAITKIIRKSPLRICIGE